MARIAGVDLPNNKRGEIGLTYIFGIGRSSAQAILDSCGIDRNIKVGDWNDEQIAAIRNLINNEYKIDIYTDNSVVVMYINDVCAYTQRIYGIQKNCWSINNYGGSITVSDLAVTLY